MSPDEVRAAEETARLPRNFIPLAGVALSLVAFCVGLWVWFGPGPALTLASAVAGIAFLLFLEVGPRSNRR